MPGTVAAVDPELDPAARRWLHDKYERLAAEEGQLAASRTSYFAAIGTVLITALVVSISYFGPNHRLLALVVTFLAALGIMISLVWLMLLHRTIDAQQMWRDGAIQLELRSPPVPGSLPVEVRLRSGRPLAIDLYRPYTAHRARFADDPEISWVDRVRPDTLTQILPGSFLVIWVAVLVGAWIAGFA